MKTIIYSHKFDDSDLGTVYIRHNRQARMFTFREMYNHIVITTPPGYGEKQIRPVVMQEKSNLLVLLQRAKEKKEANSINETFHIKTPAFEFYIQRNNEGRYRLSHPSSSVTVLEVREDFTFEGKQEWLEKMVIQEVEKFASPYLKKMLVEMSNASGLHCERMDVGHAQTRWGVCKKVNDTGIHHIILSAYTALLPVHLTKFILLHELTHTVHHDHSAAFHRRLNDLTVRIIGLTEKECENQMKNYHTNIYSFAKQSTI